MFRIAGSICHRNLTAPPALTVYAVLSGLEEHTTNNCHSFHDKWGRRYYTERGPRNRLTGYIPHVDSARLGLQLGERACRTRLLECAWHALQSCHGVVCGWHGRSTCVHAGSLPPCSTRTPCLAGRKCSVQTTLYRVHLFTHNRRKRRVLRDRKDREKRLFLEDGAEAGAATLPRCWKGVDVCHQGA